MSRSQHSPGRFSRVFSGLAHALAEDSRRHTSTPTHEALALGLGLAPAARIGERYGR